MTIGAINSNLFQDDDYMLGSLTHPSADRARQGDRAPPAVHRRHARHRVHGPEDLAAGRHELPRPGLAARPPGPARRLAAPRSTRRSTPNHRLILEYKFFEPAFYTMDIPDWGTSLLHCLALGDRALVVLDTGHHAPGTNIEFIVAQLLRAGRLGAFDFNSRFYADDDLMVGSADPFQLFRIMHEIVQSGRPGAGLGGQLHARPVPQHRAEDPRADPLGDERAGGHGQGAAGRRRRAARGAAGR